MPRARTVKIPDSENTPLLKRLTEANAEAAELVAEIEESKEQLERSNYNLAAANARAAELVAELQVRREELEWANTNLKEASEENKRLLGFTAHDIRSGLGGITSVAELLCGILEHKSVPGYVEADLIRKEGLHLLTFLDGLLDKSCAEMGHMKIRPSRIDLAALVNDSRSAHESLAHRKRQKITAIADGVFPLIHADPVRTRQVLDNLLSNAIKFSPRRSTITISMKHLGRFVEVVVTDEGPGLTAADLESVFSEFAKLSAQPTGGEESHGLGLSIVKTIVELQGGSASATNRADVSGAQFRVTFPVSGESAAKWHILAVDDQASNRHLMKKLLESRGHTVATCRDGREATEAVKYEKFDLVFMDLEMPGLNGLEASKAIRAQGQDKERLPIIALTAHSGQAILSQCLDGGINDTIQKPIDKAALEQAIARWTPQERANGV